MWCNEDALEQFEAKTFSAILTPNDQYNAYILCSRKSEHSI